MVGQTSLVTCCFMMFSETMLYSLRQRRRFYLPLFSAGTAFVRGTNIHALPSSFYHSCPLFTRQSIYLLILITLYLVLTSRYS